MEAQEEKSHRDGADEESGKDPVGVFSKDIVWKPYSFGSDGQTYDQACPEGGPGGLICCETCSKQFSAYLRQTVKDVERQKTHKAGREVREIMKAIDEAKEKLDRAVIAAQKKIPPVPPKPSEVEKTKKRVGRKSGAMKTEANPSDWNLTSTVDLGETYAITI